MSNGPQGLFHQKHDEKNRSFDSGQFWARMRDSSGTPRNEPGDMKERGVWTFEGTMSWVPYSQMSCSVGQANVHEPSHLDRVSALVKEYGHIFLFTCVKENLKEIALSRPKEFVFLGVTESWMSRGREVFLFAGIS